MCEFEKLILHFYLNDKEEEEKKIQNHISQMSMEIDSLLVILLGFIFVSFQSLYLRVNMVVFRC